MSKGIDLFFQALGSTNDGERYNAFLELMKISEEKVNWFDEYKNRLVEKLQDNNSYQRSIGIMLLCNLGKSCKQEDLDSVLSKLLPMVDDEKFITQRQYLQSIWKIAILDKTCEKKVVNQLKDHFLKCITKKHYNLLRKDILTSLLEISKRDEKSGLREEVKKLIEKEEDIKNKKEYIKLLKE